MAQFIGFLVTQLEKFLVEMVGIEGLSAFLSWLEGNQGYLLMKFLMEKSV